MRFVLDGHEELSYTYDRKADVLYLWRGDGPRAAESFETVDGHLARFDFDTGEFVGLTVFDWKSRWRNDEDPLLEIRLVPASDDEPAHPAEHHLLVCA